MLSIPIKTSLYHSEMPLIDFLLLNLKEEKILPGDILAITSKLVSRSEKRVVSKSEVASKTELIKKEADLYIGKGAYDCHLTIKHGLLIPSAGIDESNSENEEYILFPADPFESAQKIHRELRSHLGFENFGVLLTDSHTSPLRRGVTGIALSHFGFKGIKSLVGQVDLYGRPLQFTYVNHADALASMAVYQMGEANDQIPLVLLRGRKDLEFSLKDTREDCKISPEEDLYLPLLRQPIIDK